MEIGRGKKTWHKIKESQGIKTEGLKADGERFKRGESVRERKRETEIES